MRILITGGAGYLGSRLVPALLEDGHDVVVYDTFWFGDHLSGLPVPDGDKGYVLDHRRLTPSFTWLVKVRGDVRDVERFKFMVASHDCNAVIHLACISNDPSFELDESLSRTINYEAFEPLVVAAKESGVRRFVYCSTSSVYGVSDAPDVREDHPLVPLTLYNTYKAKCEPLLFAHQSPDFECVVIRPATHCGYSPRQRLDLAVNILTAQAYHLGRITVHGGEQRRPNIHVDDVVDCYRALLAADADKIRGQTFNVGAGNVSIASLALAVRAAVEAHTDRKVGIETRPIHDVRSYQVNSDKIAAVLGFVPHRTVGQAVRELCLAFDAGKIPDALDRDEYYNVRRMRHVFPELYRGAPEPIVGPRTGVLSEIDVIRGAGRSTT